MFRKTDAEQRVRSDGLIQQAEDQDHLNQETLEAVNEVFKQAIRLRMFLSNITHDDRRKIAECQVAIACNIRLVYDEAAEDEFECRTQHPEFFTFMKLAIYSIDQIPFDEQTHDDLECVDCWYCDIMANYSYFRIPDEVFMDDYFLQTTSKYFAKKTVVEVQDRLEQLVKMRL